MLMRRSSAKKESSAAAERGLRRILFVEFFFSLARARLSSLASLSCLEQKKNPNSLARIAPPQLFFLGLPPPQGASACSLGPSGRGEKPRVRLEFLGSTKQKRVRVEVKKKGGSEEEANGQAKSPSTNRALFHFHLSPSRPPLSPHNKHSVQERSKQSQ